MSTGKVTYYLHCDPRLSEGIGVIEAGLLQSSASSNMASGWVLDWKGGPPTLRRRRPATFPGTVTLPVTIFTACREGIGRSSGPGALHCPVAFISAFEAFSGGVPFVAPPPCTAPLGPWRLLSTSGPQTTKACLQVYLLWKAGLPF